MLISKRRLRWLAISLLVVCLLLLLRPTRMWIDRWAVAGLIGRQVTIGELIIHSRHSLLEARNLSWQGGNDHSRFELNARRGWIGYDQLGLIDRHPRLPKVLLQSTKLRLIPAAPRSPGTMGNWQQHLSQQLSQLEWNQVEKQLHSLNATQALRQLWNSSIEQWISRSQQILTQAEELERQTERMDNPLRFEILLQEKLASLQQLANEQASLTRQIDNLNGQIEAASTRLRKLHGEDQITLAGLVMSNSANVPSNKEHTQLCQRLAQGLGEMFWQQTGHYGEVVDQLLRASHVSKRPSYDINVRSNRHGDEWLVINDWRATGQFSYGTRVTPYRASGNWLLTHELLHRHSLEYSWQANFYRDQAQIEVRAQHASRQSATTRWVILQGPPASPAVSDPAGSDPADAPPTHRRSRIELTSQGGDVHGALTLAVNSLPWLAWENRRSPASTSADALTALKLETLGGEQAQGEQLKFAIDGNWSQASLRLQGAIPAWLYQAVAAAVDQRLQLTAAANRRRLDHEFDSQLSELQRLMTVAISHSRSIAARHGQQLLATRDRVERQLAEMTGTEFARRPGTITR